MKDEKIEYNSVTEPVIGLFSVENLSVQIAESLKTVAHFQTIM